MYLEVTMEDVLVVHVLEASEGLAEYMGGVLLGVALQLNDTIEELTTSNVCALVLVLVIVADE